MQMAQFLESLQADLDSIASVGDDAVSQAAGRLSQAIRSSAGLRLLDALSQAAVEISAQLPDGHVEVRLSGQDPNLVFVQEERAEPASGSGRRGLVRPDHPQAARAAEGERRGRRRTRRRVRQHVDRPRPVPRGSAPVRGPRVGSRLTGFAKS